MRWKSNKSKPLIDEYGLAEEDDNSIVIIDVSGKIYFDLHIIKIKKDIIVAEKNWNAIKDKIAYWQYMNILYQELADKIVLKWLELRDERIDYIKKLPKGYRVFQKHQSTDEIINETSIIEKGNLYIKQSNQWFLMKNGVTKNEARKLLRKLKIKVGNYIFEEHDEILNNNIKKCMEKYYNVLSMKYNQTHFKDDYGKMIITDWDKEILYFITTIVPSDYPKLKSIIFNIFNKKSPFYNEKIEKKFLNNINDLYTKIDKEMGKLNQKINIPAIHSGVDYEHYIEMLLQNNGFNISRTPITGDQGVDLVAEKHNIRIAIQCKYYSKPVGNKAVQEVIAGRDFYNCQRACVVSNNSFTPAARKIANVSNILLLNDNQIVAKLNEFIK